jgi:uncharacterized membrane protein
MSRKSPHVDEYTVIKRAKIAAYQAASDVTSDHALLSFALLELALLIAIGTRARVLTKLEHRDRVLDTVSSLHDQTWDATGDLFAKIQGDRE